MRAPASMVAATTPGGLGRVVLSYQVYVFVEIAVWLAIILWAYAEGGAALAGLVAVVQLVPAAVLSPVLVAWSGRFSRSRALAMAHAGVGVSVTATTTTLLLGSPVWLVVAASTVATTGFAVVRPLHFATLPQLARTPALLVSGNSVAAVGEGFARSVAPLFAGAAAQLAGPSLVFVVSSALSLAAWGLTTRLRLPPVAVPKPRSASWHGALSGLARLWRGGTAMLIVILSTRFVISGAMDLLGVSASTEMLDEGQWGAGLIIGALGVGGLVGGLAAATFARRRSLGLPVVVTGVLQGLVLVFVVYTTALVSLVVLVALSGACSAVMLVAGRTLVQRSTDDPALASVFAMQEGASLVGVALGAGMAPWLIDRFNPSGAFVPLGIGTALVTVAGAVMIWRLDGQAVIHHTEAALLRRVPFLAALPQYALERLAASASWLEVNPGDDVIREGDAGDCFYVVESGAFTVTVRGSLRPHRLRAGDSFGEIALLRSVRRTATVTAAEPGRLLSVDAEAFLAAVTGTEDGEAMACEVAAAHVARDALIAER